MSLVSRAVRRLRDLWEINYRRNAFCNAMRFSYPSDQHSKNAVVLIETLEPRIMLSVYTVNTLSDIVADDGVISLREAIEAANTNTAVTADVVAGSDVDTDTISFDQAALEAEAISANPAWILADGLKIDLGGNELTITEDLDISGLGDDVLIIDGNESSGVIVVNGDNTDLLLSGLGITNGTGFDLPGLLSCGGGICFIGNSLTLMDCSISNNYAGAYGGGVYFEGNQLEFTNCSISGNRGYGGGIFVESASTLTVTNGIIANNSSRANGGGMYVSDETCLVTVIGSTVSDNSTYNSDWHGGGIFCIGTLVVEDSTILRNIADGYGGGIYASTSLTVRNSIIAGNKSTAANYGGGGIYGKDYIEIINSVIVGNSALYRGGGICIYSGPIVVTNSTIVGNTAYKEDGIGKIIESDITLSNSIVALNGENLPDTFAQTNSLIGVDPGFIRNPSQGIDGVWGTEDDDYGDLRLTSTSGAVNLGDNSLLPSGILTDLDNHTRIEDGIVDAGAYEYQGSPEPNRETPSLTVTTSNDIFNLYDNQISLREALWYDLHDDTLGSNIVFDSSLSQANFVLEGESLLILSDINIDASSLSDKITIDAEQESRVFHINGMGISAEITNLAITGGHSNGDGGAFLVGTDSSLVLTNSMISKSTSGTCGAGLFGGENSTITVINSTISENSTIWYHAHGGGIYGSQGCMINVINSQIKGNSTNQYDSGGGAIYGSDTCIINVTHSVIMGNSAEGSGGGIYGAGSIINITNSVITDNLTYQSDSGGGGIYGKSNSTINVTNSTIANNNAGRDGYGIYKSNSVLTLNNSIVAQNESQDIAGTYLGSNNFIGEIDGDPLFVDAANGNFTPLSSLCIDTGDNTLAIYPEGAPILTDIIGNNRIIGGTVDIGATEFDPNRPYLQMDQSSLHILAEQTQAIQLRLAVQPVSEITIILEGYHPDVTPSQSVFTFTQTNWDQYQTLYFTASSDALDGVEGSYALVENGNPLQFITIETRTPIVVDTLGDNIAEDGLISLREAIEAANKNIPIGDVPAGSDILMDYITFNKSALEAEAVAADPSWTPTDGLNINLAGTALTISDDLTIIGLGDDVLTIDGNSKSQVFYIYENTTELIDVSLSGLTITGGQTTTYGGGIYSRENLTLYDVTVSENIVEGLFAQGAGILNLQGILTVINSTISKNTTSGDYMSYGGGICNYGTATIINSTICENISDRFGGGISNSGTLTLNNSVVALNNAETEDDIYGSYTNNSSFIGTIDGDPLLMQLESNGQILYRPFADSPLIDAGDTSLSLDSSGNPLTTDQIGNDRVLGTSVDIGSIESPELFLCSLDSPSQGILEGKTGTIEFWLSDIPTTPMIVTISPTAGSSTDITLSTYSLTYDATNWNIAQSIEITVPFDVAENQRQATFECTMDSDTYQFTASSIEARWVVDSLADTIAADGELTLREAIEASESNYAVNEAVAGRENQEDYIVFAPSLSGGTIVLNDVLSIDSDDVQISAHLLSSGIIIDAAGNDQAFNISGRETSIFGMNIIGAVASGIYNHEGTVSLTNCILSKNLTYFNGGGIYNDGNRAKLILTNCTVSGNSSTKVGGGIYNPYGTVILNNSIVALNGGGDIEGNYTSMRSFVGMDPGFVRNPDDGGDGWGDNPYTTEIDESANDDFGDLHLTATSAALNFGENALAVDPYGLLIATDIEGNARIFDGSVDVGAYEFQGSSEPGRENPSFLVTTIDDIFDLYDNQNSLREALWHASYSSAPSNTITFDSSLNGGTIALAGSELFIASNVGIDASTLVNGLTIDAQGTSRVFNIDDHKDSLSDVFISGLTITGGVANNVGGGIYSFESLSLDNVIITNNYSAEEGGGIYGKITTVSNSKIINNFTNGLGGGILGSYGSTVTVTNSIISENSAEYGGGIYGYNHSTIVVSNSAISNNDAGGIYGGSSAVITVSDSTISSNGAAGIYGDNSTITVTYSTISENYGGGIYGYLGNMTVSNSLIVGNSTTTYGGGIRGASMTITNSTIVGNSADSGGGIYESGGISGGTINLNNSIVTFNDGGDISGNYISTGSLIGTNPGFVKNPDDGGDGWGDDPNTPEIDESVNDDYGDLHLLSGSPAIDAGENSLAVDVDGLPLTVDLGGNPRITDGDGDGEAIVDIGAYEVAAVELPPLLAGDANRDGIVSAADYAAVRENFGNTGAPGIPGDANGDGVVSANDFGSIQANFGNVAQVQHLDGDANGDGIVSASDYAAVRENFGKTGAPGIPGDANGDGVVSADDFGSIQANFGGTSSIAADLTESESSSLESTQIVESKVVTQSLPITATAKPLVPFEQKMPTAKSKNWKIAATQITLWSDIATGSKLNNIEIISTDIDHQWFSYVPTLMQLWTSGNNFILS